MKKKGYFSYKKEGLRAYDYLKKRKIVAILENFVENNIS